MIGLAVLQAATAQATPGTRNFDIQCMAATQAASEQLEDKNLAMLNQMAMMYFMGRIDQDVADAALGKELEQTIKAMSGKPLGPLLMACGEHLKVRGKRFQDIGAAIEKRESARQTR